jgi:uncharacterized protein
MPAMLSPTLLHHLDPQTGPKRILSLDGGGMRGVVTLQYLKRLEALLRLRRGDPQYLLSDYFDLIGGTSTGAIIAAGLAQGMNVADIEKMYQDLAARIFKRGFLRLGALLPKFGRGHLQAALQQAYGAETTLSSPTLRTGLMVMTKRMDTSSPWPLTNHPRDPYFSPVPGKKRIGHANMYLWQVVRASTAAPHFFRPERLEVGHASNPQTGQTTVEIGEFIDGGVTTANNPAMQLLKVALLKGFAFNWRPGADQLLLISIGTGLPKRKRGLSRGLQRFAAPFAMNALKTIMDDCNAEVELMMQWLSDSQTARTLNGQLGSLSLDQRLGGQALLTYQRYNLQFEADGLGQLLGTTFDAQQLQRLQAMDEPKNMPELTDLAARAAELQLQPQHLPAAFDPPVA